MEEFIPGTMLSSILGQWFSKWSERDQHHLGTCYNCLFLGLTPDLLNQKLGEQTQQTVFEQAHQVILMVLKCENHGSRAVNVQFVYGPLHQNQLGLMKQNFCVKFVDTDLSHMHSVVGFLFDNLLERIISLVLSS